MRKDMILSCKRAVCSILLLLAITNFPVSLADMPNPGPREHNVEIQGAKLISEGGYLWFRVTNHEFGGLCVEVHSPADVIVIHRVSQVVVLEANESTDFYFQVPYYWNGNAIVGLGQMPRLLKFTFELFNLYRMTRIGTENVEFDVNVLPLNWKVDNLSPLYFVILVSMSLIALVVFIAAKRWTH